MKFLFFILLLIMPLMSSAQVNTGGPDFNIEGVTVFYSELAKVLRMNQHSKAPTVLHDLSSKTYIAGRTEDLYKIFQVYRPDSADKFIRILQDESRFIPLDHYEYIYFIGGHPSEELQFVYSRVFSLETGITFPMFSARGNASTPLIEKVLGQVRMTFGDAETQVIYFPSTSPVW
jgi:hypothetical protein